MIDVVFMIVTSWIKSLMGLLLLPIFALSLTTSPAIAQDTFHPALDPQEFPVPPALLPAVEFWRDVFGRYASTQTLIHDDEHLDVVFAVVDVADLVERGASAVAIQRAQQDRVRTETRKYEQVLRRLGGDGNANASEPDMDQVRQLYASSSRQADDFRAAASRVRGQSGLKDRFREAIEVSGMFMPGIEAILGAHDVPAIVKSLPFVESMYNFRARSRVGASGVWQMMPGTARQYMQMDSAVDARSDVLLAAEGAARLLADNYRRVLSWPLALTGYNHGIAGMERAVRQVGSSSIDAIVENYQSRTFGFASRNFYAEFVAAATVFADRAKFFPGVEPLQAVEFEAFTPGRFVSMLDLSSLTGTSVDALVTLNPALHEDVSLGTLLIPPQYPLRVPPGRLAEFGRAFQRLPDSRKRDRQITATYRVASGDNLGAIARRFGTSTTALQRANNLPRADRIYINQVLEIPNGGGTWSPLVWSPGAAPVEGAQVHVVQRGETLAAIGSRYGQSVQALVAANNISSPNRIQVGARITIPGSTLLDGPTVHIVQHGDTVTQIARRYGRSVQALITANNLTAPDSLRVGARLSIPAAE